MYFPFNYLLLATSLILSQYYLSVQVSHRCLTFFNVVCHRPRIIFLIQFSYPCYCYLCYYIYFVQAVYTIFLKFYPIKRNWLKRTACPSRRCTCTKIVQTIIHVYMSNSWHGSPHSASSSKCIPSSFIYFYRFAWRERTQSWKIVFSTGQT